MGDDFLVDKVDKISRFLKILNARKQYTYRKKRNAFAFSPNME